MPYSTIGLFVLALLAQAGRGDLVVRTKISAVPPESFKRGADVMLAATFQADNIPTLSGACGDRGFAIRVYDAALVVVNPPRISADTFDPSGKPVTPYLQQAGAPEEPKSGPNAVTAEKRFEAVNVPLRRPARLPRLYVGLFHICGASLVKGINESGTGLIHDDPLNGSYMGGTFFTAHCAGTPRLCTYRPE